jgi:aminoglycoside phosphotransferase family enzyme/predicted kinase
MDTERPGFDARLQALVDLLGGERVVRTHAAAIILAGDRAWKLKRPVRFDYLDFSTVEKRHAALERELHLNRRTAPDLYLALHPVHEDEVDGRLKLGGAGTIVDWLLEMQRFPDGALLDQLAEQGPLDPNLLRCLADTIAALLAEARRGPCAGGAERVASVLRGNRDALGRFPETFLPDTVEPLLRLQEKALAAHANLLDARAAAGRVRHGHGDLHLGNIAQIDGVPTPFDCLEFSDELATTDTLYDLAYLLMDLWRHGDGRGAGLVLNQFLDRTPEDEAGWPLLPMFLSLRATIRAHVLAAAGDADGARARLRLATHLLEPQRPRLVAIGGLSGSGKSTIARALGGLGGPPGARIVRSDVVRKHRAGVPLEERLPESRYTPAETAQVMADVRARLAAVLAAGGVAVADTMHARRADRDAVEAVARAAGVPFTGLWLEAPVEVRLARVEGRSGDVSDADRAVALRQEAIAVGDLGGWHRVDACRSAAEVTARVLDLLSG